VVAMQKIERGSDVRMRHNGAEIEITRVKVEAARRFYIEVTWCDGRRLYSGYASSDITKLADAKKEAIRQACLK
jgi:hypothetical protein